MALLFLVCGLLHVPSLVLVTIFSPKKTRRSTFQESEHLILVHRTAVIQQAKRRTKRLSRMGFMDCLPLRMLVASRPPISHRTANFRCACFTLTIARVALMVAEDCRMTTSVGLRWSTFPVTRNIMHTCCSCSEIRRSPCLSVRGGSFSCYRPTNRFATRF
jgi:hypothetical protein